MTASKGLKGINRGVIAAAIVVVVTAAVIVVSLTSRYSSREEGSDGRAGSEETRAGRGSVDALPLATPSDKRGKRRKGPPFVYRNKLAEKAQSQGLGQRPRPLRLVVSYGDRGRGRSEEEARQMAEEARRRFLAGEDSYQLIREVSDAPRGIPPELLKRWAHLRPGQASPVFPVKNGFAVFFGTPEGPLESAPPDAGSH